MKDPKATDWLAQWTIDSVPVFALWSIHSLFPRQARDGENKKWQKNLYSMIALCVQELLDNTRIKRGIKRIFLQI